MYIHLQIVEVNVRSPNVRFLSCHYKNTFMQIRRSYDCLTPMIKIIMQISSWRRVVLALMNSAVDIAGANVMFNNQAIV